MHSDQDGVGLELIQDFDYAAFRQASKRDWPHYRLTFRGKLSILIPDQAQTYVSAWITKHCNGASADDLISGALKDAHLNGLGLVCAAILAMRSGDFTRAAVLAERAYSADQHEVFAQRIFLAAQEGNKDLHLDVDDWLEDKFCDNPFTDVEIIGSKDAYTCCAAWLPAPIGAADDDAQDIWMGPRAAELRRSILDGDFSYCSRLNCPKIAGRQLPRKKDVTNPIFKDLIERKVPAVVPRPDRVLFSYDTSCNLSCPSCRSELISFGRKAAAKLDQFYFDHVTKFTNSASRIKITGSGDPFGSNHFRRVLKDLTTKQSKEPRLQLQTNGVLFDERAWNDLALSGHVRSVWISIDATEAETYAELRRGGDFDRLMTNLHFLASKRKAGEIGELRFDFVVQEKNFRQMPAFAEMAKTIGADGTHFLLLRNWGTFSPKEYKDQAIAFDDHPAHQEFLDVLLDSRLTEPGVDLGNLEPLRQKALARPKASSLGQGSASAKAIVVLGMPRVGSNYLFECFQNIRDIFAVREVFNPKGAFGLDAYDGVALARFGRKLFKTDLDIKNQELIDHVRRNPSDAIRELRHVADERGKDYLALKIFCDHLDPAVLLDDILADAAVIPVVCRRSLLACYISWMKAREAQTWVNVDVTHLKPEIDVDAYLEWQTKTIDWYQSIARAITSHGKKLIVMDYETIVAPDPVKMIDTLFAEFPIGEMPINNLAPSYKSKIKRQDLCDTLFDRIQNGPEVQKKLDDLGHLQTALGLAPLA